MVHFEYKKLNALTHYKTSFLLTIFCIASPKIILPDRGPVVGAFAGAEFWISATGTPPVFMTLIKDSTILEKNMQTINRRLFVEGNYSCLAVNNYGNVTRVDFQVVFFGRY